MARRSPTSPRTGVKVRSSSPSHAHALSVAGSRQRSLLHVVADDRRLRSHPRAQGREAGRAAGAHRAGARDDRSESRRARRRPDPRRTAAGGRAARRAVHIGPRDPDRAARHVVVHERWAVCRSAASVAGTGIVACRRFRAAAAHGAGRDLGRILGQRAEPGHARGCGCSAQNARRQRHRRRVRDARLRSAERSVTGCVLRLSARAAARRRSTRDRARRRASTIASAPAPSTGSTSICTNPGSSSTAASSRAIHARSRGWRCARARPPRRAE